MIDPKIVIHSAEIPPVPRILQQIMSLADDPNTTSAALEKIVSQEPGLVTRLLKWVNSALYALPYKVSSVSHAMILLGFSTVRSIASGMILMDCFSVIPSLDKKFVLFCWKKGLYAANFLKVFGEKLPLKDVDDLYLTAMIHNIGRLVLVQYFQKDYTAICHVGDLPSTADERKTVGLDHAETGAALLKEWNFPSAVIDLLRRYRVREDEMLYEKLMAYMQVALILSYSKDLDHLLLTNEEDLTDELKMWLGHAELKWESIQAQTADLSKAQGMVNILFSE